MWEHMGEGRVLFSPGSSTPPSPAPSAALRAHGPAPGSQPLPLPDTELLKRQHRPDPTQPAGVDRARSATKGSMARGAALGLLVLGLLGAFAHGQDNQPKKPVPTPKKSAGGDDFDLGDALDNGPPETPPKRNQHPAQPGNTGDLSDQDLLDGSSGGKGGFIRVLGARFVTPARPVQGRHGVVHGHKARSQLCAHICGCRVAVFMEVSAVGGPVACHKAHAAG
ncbi:CD99 antigen isoform X3 [Nannospalax galili]|uniref:CD99 antigen isoform X3 n=1 Tax=Nannospalax galili TaxID=1026970 RepID=UPI00111C3486|nr:CD99 antigen isoform X3 [Nannospalax galili]